MYQSTGESSENGWMLGPYRVPKNIRLIKTTMASVPLHDADELSSEEKKEKIWSQYFEGHFFSQNQLANH